VVGCSRGSRLSSGGERGAWDVRSIGCDPRAVVNSREPCSQSRTTVLLSQMAVGMGHGVCGAAVPHASSAIGCKRCSQSRGCSPPRRQSSRRLRARMRCFLAYPSEVEVVGRRRLAAGDAVRSTSILVRPIETMMKTTDPGYVNRNNQEVVRATGLEGTDHLQRVYVLRCGLCLHQYGANGSDIF
jgi:hypothetical protein